MEYVCINYNVILSISKKILRFNDSINFQIVLCIICINYCVFNKDRTELIRML